jgi:hypothetical protein
MKNIEIIFAPAHVLTDQIRKLGQGGMREEWRG